MSQLDYYSHDPDSIRLFEKDLNVQGQEIALDIILKEGLILDSRFIEVMRAAEVGVITAWAELSLGFGYGKNGLPVNHKLSRYYFDKFVDGCMNDETYSEDPKLLFQACRGYGYFELINGDRKKSFDYFLRALDIMLKEFPQHDWDSDLFLFLYHSSQDLVS